LNKLGALLLELDLEEADDLLEDTLLLDEIALEDGFEDALLMVELTALLTLLLDTELLLTMDEVEFLLLPTCELSAELFTALLRLDELMLEFTFELLEVDVEFQLRM